VSPETFDDILAVTVSSTGDYWAAASRRGEIRVWEAGGLTLRHAWRAHTDMVWALTFSPDGRMLASGSWDGTLKLWDVASGAVLWDGRHASHMHHVAFAPDGRTLASSEWDNAIRLWDSTSGTCTEVLHHPEDSGNYFYGLAWSPDGQRLAGGTSRRGVLVWDLTARGAIEPELTSFAVTACSWSAASSKSTYEIPIAGQRRCPSSVVVFLLPAVLRCARVRSAPRLQHQLKAW